MKIINLLIFFIISYNGFCQQKELQVNGKPYSSNSCAEIKQTLVISDTLIGIRADIRDAQINEDCLELTVVYGGCNGNLELMTDNKISDLSNPKLNFKLKWIEPSFCKALMLVHISFDLKPYKQLVKDKMAVIKIMGTSFELNYDN